MLNDSYYIKREEDVDGASQRGENVYEICRSARSSMDDSSDGNDRLSGESSESPMYQMEGVGFVPKCFVTDNAEEVWYLTESEQQPAANLLQSFTLAPLHTGNTPSALALNHTVPSTNDTAGKRSAFKRKLSPTSVSDRSVTSSDDQYLFTADDDAEFTESVLSALDPSPYAAIRRERRRRMRIPVLLKRDIRRYYLHMLTNVINSHDSELLKSFLNTYCDANVILHRSSPAGFNSPTSSAVSTALTNGNKCMKHSFDLLHLKEIFAFWATKFDLFADHTCKFTEMKVITSRANESVRVEGSFVVHHTDIYEMTPMMMHALFLQKVYEHSGHVADPSYLFPYERMAQEDVSTIREEPSPLEDDHVDMCSGLNLKYPSHRDSSEEQIKNFLARAKATPYVLAKAPQEMYLEGRIVLLIAPNRRIEHIQLIPDNIKFSPVVIRV